MDPFTHFLLGPIFLITFSVAIYLAVHVDSDRLLHVWLAVVAFALLVLNYKARVYALRVQDRIIRLEEHIRLTVLLPPTEAVNAVRNLTTPQLIALRFASDAELPALVTRTLVDHLAPKQIKEAITDWRPDLARV